MVVAMGGGARAQRIASWWRDNFWCVEHSKEDSHNSNSNG